MGLHQREFKNKNTGDILMKKLFSGILTIALIAAWAPMSFGAAVNATRAAIAGDLADGAVFDNAGAWVLTSADNEIWVGAVTTAGAGGANAGTLTYAGTATVGGQVGTGANALLAVNAGVASEIVTLNADVFATTFNVTGTGTVNADSITGAVEFDGAGVKCR